MCMCVYVFSYLVLVSYLLCVCYLFYLYGSELRDFVGRYIDK